MTWTKHRSRARAAAALFAVVLTGTLAATASAIPPDAANNPLLQPIDAQDWVDQAELTWDAYTQIRPDAWNSATTSHGQPEPVQDGDHPARLHRPALPDHAGAGHASVRQPAARLDAGPAGPGRGLDVRLLRRAERVQRRPDHARATGWRTQLRQVRRRRRPSSGRTACRASSSSTASRRRLQHARSTQYCPQGAQRATGTSAPTAAPPGGPTIGCAARPLRLDNIFYVTAGQDESSTWQEFGEMLLTDREPGPGRVRAAGAPRARPEQPGQPMPNWATTRYVPWTSWRAAANLWPNAGGSTSTQAESSGHERLRPRVQPPARTPGQLQQPVRRHRARAVTGYWDMMSRGTFNGPGGTHNRWQIPNAGGSGLGAQHMLHFKNRSASSTPTDQVTLQRDTLADPGPRGACGQGARGRSRTATSSASRSTSTPPATAATWPAPARTRATRTLFYCPNRVGRLTRLPARGRRTASATTRSRPATACCRRRAALVAARRFVWFIDANPQDIGMVDFYRPDGTPVPVVRGDPRQLNDATFHAGTNSGSEVRVRGHVQQAALLRAREAHATRTACSRTTSASAARRRGPVRRAASRSETRRRRRSGRASWPRARSRSRTRARRARGSSTRTSTASPPRPRAGLAGHAAERARGGEGGPDRAGSRARPPGPGRRHRRADDRAADRDLRGRRLEDRDEDLRGACP